jgi:aspartate kinase
MALIVQKFGGTSVATPEAREALLNQVRKCIEAGNDVVVVVSAMGRFGDPYATDTLISLFEQIDPKIDSKKKDLLMSCGEIISCSLVSHLLEVNNIPSIPMTGFQAGILTNNNFTNSEIININTTAIKKHLQDGKVVVIAGFQGATADGEITTLGRGGSDTAAVAIGAYLEAERVDIFTDVPGIAKVDPRVVSIAPYLTAISYEDMYELAYNGAKVIHPRAVKTAKDFKIPVRVRSTFTEDLGTLISEESTIVDHILIGMALEKEVEISDSKEPIGKIFMTFDGNRKEEIEKKLHSFTEEANLIFQNIVFNNNHVSVLLPTNRLVETVKSLYAYLH